MNTPTVSPNHSCTFRHDPDPDTEVKQAVQLHGLVIAECSYWQCKTCLLYFKHVSWGLFYITESNFPTEITLEQYREKVVTLCL